FLRAMVAVSPRRSRRCPMSVERNLAIAITSLVLVVGVASAQEKKIKRSDLPAAVERTVAAQSAGAVIIGFSQEREHGRPFYEAEMTVNGHTKDLLIDSTGAVVEVEEEVALNELPTEVRAGLAAKAGTGKIVKVESIKKGDKLVAYEAHLDTNGK